MSKPLFESDYPLSAPGHVLRYLGLSDLERMNRIEQRSHQCPWSSQNLASSLTNQHHVLGLFRGQTLVGYAILAIICDEAELLLLVVDKSHQGQGLGRRCLEGLKALMPAFCQHVFLEVRESNRAAISLYETVGFNQMGTRPAYYPALERGAERETALIYGLYLAS